jgi:arabinosyltransferase
MKPRYSSSSADEEQEGRRNGDRRVGGGWSALASDLSARLVPRAPAGGGGNSGNGGGATALALVFCVGLALGLAASERLYLAGALSAAAAASPLTSSATSALVAAAPSDPASCACARSGGGGGTVVGGPTTNHSNWLTPLPASERAALADLEQLLLSVAPTREVLVALSDKNPLREGMLDTFLRGAADVAGITNYVVVALDAETETALKQRNRNVFFLPAEIPAAQRDTGNNHAVSALKFGVLRKFLRLGWSVLLSDVDVAVLSDPFSPEFASTPRGLYRDSDVEGMSDGFDSSTAYGSIDGYEDVSMGWSRYAQVHKAFNLNSGLFFARSNDRTVELMRRLEERLSRTKYWDQTAYNEELFFMPHGSITSPQCTVRVMDIYAFMNSKVLFKDVRLRRKEDKPPHPPAMVHINYHPDKHARMLAVLRHYADGDERALDGLPGGSEPGT